MFSYQAVLTYVLGAQKNRLIEMVSFEYPQHMFWLRNKKVIFVTYMFFLKVYENPGNEAGQCPYCTNSEIKQSIKHPWLMIS